MTAEEVNSSECRAIDALAIMDLAQANVPPVVGTPAWDAEIGDLAARPATESSMADSLVDMVALAG